MRFCPDANALIAWLLTDERTELVDAFWSSLSNDDEIVASQLLLAEASSTLREKVFDGLITYEVAEGMLSQALSIPMTVVTDKRQFSTAFEIARATRRRKSYDMQYVAVAELEGAEIVTLDGGVYQVAIERRIPARLLR